MSNITMAQTCDQNYPTKLQFLGLMLKISSVSWQKQNCYGLCDFKEISKAKKKEFSICGSGIIYRNIATYDLTFISLPNVPKKGTIPDHEPIIYVTEKDSRFKFTDLKNVSNQDEPLALIAPTGQKLQDNLAQRGNCLQIFEGSILRLGKTKIQIVKIESQSIKTRNQYTTDLKPFVEGIKKISFSNYSLAFQNKKEQQRPIQKFSPCSTNDDQIKPQSNFSMFDENPPCKICYSRTLQIDNPLISLCKCSGTSKFIHEKCLKKWVQQKSQAIKLENVKNKPVYMASMSGLKCQICKQLYPLDQIFNLLFNIQEHKLKQYIALSLQEEGKQLLYLVDLEQSPVFSIGRDFNNAIVINELTVSRNHCQIRYDEKIQALHVTDLGSKFGTSIKKASIIINSKIGIHRLQKGRTCLEITKVKNVECKGLFSKFMMCYNEMN